MKPSQLSNHHPITRRQLLKYLGLSTAASFLPATSFAASIRNRPVGANDDVRIALIGIGSKKAKGGVGGRGLQLLDSIQKVPHTRVVALCDVDKDILQSQVSAFRDKGIPVRGYSDLRRVFDDKEVDAVVVATPNHWHALATVWACQAGKDVYVEKPVSYNIWEGRQMVEAARKYVRMVQAGTQARSSSALQEAVQWIQQGQLGRIQYARIILYRQRNSIGKTSQPLPIPEGVDYDLWCGPAPIQPLLRKQLHYDWHWSWHAGSGEMGNNGVHYVDICRWAMGIKQTAPQVVSVGGRYAFNDDGETPNTQIALLDFKPAPIYCEIRGLPTRKGATTMDSFRGTSMGVIFQCEGGYFKGAHLQGAACDNDGKVIREFGPIPWGQMDTGHMANFIDAVRSRKRESLHAEILEGHLSAACCHQVNISHRVGHAEPGAPIADPTHDRAEWADTIERYREHLKSNELVDSPHEVRGAVLKFDPRKERFLGESSREANALLTRSYRAPFIVPQIA